MQAFKTVYVTGAPAFGKSSTMSMLEKRISGLNVWEYGARLTEFLQTRGGTLRNQDELRARSAGIVQPSDIVALDEQLLEWTAVSRISGHTVIDSHPITKEKYGFRVTGFSAEKIVQLRPNEIWLFYVAPEVTLERIARHASGRPTITLEEANMHNTSQASVARIYGVIAGCPVYMFDTAIDQTELVDQLTVRLAS